MASMNFPTRSMAWKLAMWEAVEESMLTGQVTKVQTAGGVSTEFDPRSTSPDAMLERLRESITNDDAFDATNAVQAAIASGGRVAITRSKFC